MKKIFKDNNGKFVFVLGIVFTFIAPIVLIRPAVFEWFVFANDSFANIGSTIGGITAPIVGLVGAWLLYLTLQEQKSANRDNILLNSIQQLDSLIIVSGVSEINNEVEEKLKKNFNAEEMDEGTGSPRVNLERPVTIFAHKHILSLMNIAIQIEIIFNNIEHSSSEIIKQRLAGVIYNLKNTVAYNSVLQSRTSILESNGEILTPISTINKVGEGLKKWEIKSPLN